MFKIIIIKIKIHFVTSFIISDIVTAMKQKTGTKHIKHPAPDTAAIAQHQYKPSACPPIELETRSNWRRCQISPIVAIFGRFRLQFYFIFFLKGSHSLEPLAGANTQNSTKVSTHIGLYLQVGACRCMVGVRVEW